MQLSKRIIAMLLTVAMMLSMPITAWAAPDTQTAESAEPTTVEIPIDTVVTDEAPTKEQRLEAMYEAHDAMADRKQFLESNRYVTSDCIGNEFIEFCITNDSSGAGRFTIGNVEGNPNYESDDEKILIYGHPYSTTSYSTIQIDGTAYIFTADDIQYNHQTLTSTATMTVEGVLVTQFLQIVESSTDGIADTVKISYQVQNNSGVSKNIGVRIMMDTMLGNNDGAPFKVPSLGNVTKERELVGNDVPQFWQCFDNLDDPSVFAVGTFYKSGERKPDKVQFAYWSDIYHSYNAWDYTIDPSQAVTGDSAVAAYWNPVSVANNSAFSVNTYYGVGYATGDAETSTSTQVGADGFSVQVVDETGAQISGATVTAQNLPTAETETTDRGGLATFSTVPAGTGDSRSVTLKVEKAGYRTMTVTRDVIKGGFTAVTLYPDDGRSHIASVTGEIDGRSIDLLSGYKHFKENSADTEAASNNSNVKWLNITVDAIGGSTEITKYQLLQGGEVKVESSTPSFRIAVFTGTPSDPDKYGSDWRIDKLDAGKNVTLRVVEANGDTTAQKTIGIKVSKPTLYGMGNTDGSLEFGRELKISVPSHIPIIGDTEIELGWNGLPFQFAVTEDGKVKFAINPKIDMLSGEVDWGNAQKEFETKQLDAVEGQLMRKHFGGEAQKFGAGTLSVDANIMGYGEGYIDENGNVQVQVGLLVAINQEAGYTWTFFLGYVPVYVAVGEKVTLAAQGTLNIVGSNGNISVTGSDVTINPKITLNVDGGVGANGVLNIGASGRATLSWTHRFSDSYNLVDLTGGMYIVAQAFLFKAEKKLAEGTWTIYEGYGSNSRSLNSQLLAQSTDFYDSGSYSQMPRTYLASAAPYAADSEIVKSGVYTDASPMLVKCGDTSYLFWLDDITTRDASNRTALVYATSTDGESWSDPVQLFEETETSTADFEFDICVAEDDIHIALCKENTQFTEETATLDAMAAASEIYYAKIDTDTGDITSKRLTNNNYADTMPRIAMVDGSVMVVYAQNMMEDGFFGSENTHQFVYTRLNDHFASFPVEGLISDLALGELDGQTGIAYVVDTDRDYNTEEDTELRMFNERQDLCLAEAGSGAASPVFTQLDGSNVLLWYADNNVYYTDGEGNAQTVFESIPYNFNRNFFAIEGDDHTELVWVGSAGSQENSQSAAYAVSYRNGRWSEAYKMFDIESELTMTLDGYSEDGKTYVTYLKTYGVQEDNPFSSLCVSAVTPEYDLTLVDYAFDANAVAPNEDLPFTVTVKNNGNEDIDDFYLHLKNFNGFSFETAHIENADLKRGETKTYTVDGLTLPSWLDNAYEFSVEVECDNESNYDDNSATFTMGYTDLAVETNSLLVNGEDHLNIVVKNLSNIPSDAILRIHADSTEGAVLYEKRLTNVTKDSVNTILVNLNRLNNGTSIDNYYIVLTATAEECLLSDNTQLIYRALTNEQLYTLSVNAGEGGYVSGDIGGTFSAGAQLTVTAVENRGYRFIGWTSDCDIEFSDATALTTTFTMPSANATVTAQFEDVSIRPELNHSSVNMRSEQTVQLEYYIGSEEDIEDSLFWTSTNTNVATVDENGLITAVGEGYAEITLTSNDNRVFPATCAVYVDNGPYIELYLDNYNIELEAGETFQQTYYCDTDIDYEDTLYWESSNPEIAAVDENGLITAVGNGTAEITLYSTDDRFYSTTCVVKVVGVIRTEDFTDLETEHQYGAYEDITWIFSMPCASSITLTFDEQSCTEHSYDKLNISTPDDSIFNVGYSGSELSGLTVEIPGDQVVLHFTSDGSVEEWGFKVVSAVANGYAHNTDGIGGTCSKCYTGWASQSGKWYCCVKGTAQTGWQLLGGVWYYMNAQGVMMTGWQLVGGTWYYFQASGAMATGWLQSGTTWYYLQSSGAMVTGWKTIGGVWYYFNTSGAMQTGWLKDGNTWYYMNTSGAMVTGTVTIGGKQHAFNSSGAWLGEVTQNGWVQEGGKWYYYQNSTKVTGWKAIGGVWYYFTSDGAMVTGWKQVGSTWYYFKSSGAMTIGWLQIGGTWYYLKSSGAMQTGWLKDDNTWYYFHGSGAMATGSVKIGNKTYNFNASGACLNP